jgi:hypothetical protein
MSDEELRQAADRLVMDYESAGGSGNPYRHEKAANRYEDGWNVALAWLEDHPADDGEPVTEEWLRAVGFKDEEYSFVLRSPYTDDWYHHLRHTACSVRKVDWKWHANGIGVADQPTRGHVRRLCAALGVPLKETTA